METYDPWRYSSPSPSRSAKHALAQRIRELVELTAQLDSDSTSPECFLQLMVASGKVQKLLANAPRLREPGPEFTFGPGNDPLVERGPVSGLSNPFSPALTMSATSGDTVRASGSFSVVHQGPPGMVHGGVLLMVFDEVLAFGQRTSGQIGMTGTVTVKLLGSVPINTRVDFDAGTDRVEGRKKFVWARASVGGQVAAEATAICILPRQRSGTEPESTAR